MSLLPTPHSPAAAGGPSVLLEGVHVIRRAERREFHLAIQEFCAEPGDIVAVTGPSGTGKSTFLDLLACIVPPAAARRFLLCGTELAGRKLAAQEAAQLRRSIGFVLQHGALLPFLRVEDNIRLGGALAGKNASATEISELARSLGIASLLRATPARISGGQRQRVALARALAHRPALVLADEPTGSVDAAQAGEIGGLLRGAATQHQLAVVLVTHDAALADSIATRRYQVESAGQTGDGERVKSKLVKQ